MKLVKSLRGMAAAFALTAAAGSSQAACCVFDSASIVAAIAASTAAITGTIVSSTAWSTGLITSTIKGAQAADSANRREVATKIIAANQTRVNEVYERFRVDDRYRVTDPCSIMAPTDNLSDVTTMAAASVQAGSIGMSHRGGPTSGLSSSLASALAISKGSATAPAVESLAAMSARGGCETFAAGGGARDARCRAAGIIPGNSGGYVNGDLKADVLMDGPTEGRKRYSVDLKGRDGAIIDAFMRNVTSPLVLRDLKPGEASTDEGRRYLALKDAYDARMSLGERPMRRHLAQIAANPTTGAYVGTLMSSKDADFVADYVAKHAAGGALSLDDVMNLEVRRKHFNAAWHERMAGASPEEVLREQIQINAYTNVLLANLIYEVREVGVAAGASALAQARAEMIPQLVQQHRAAAR